MSLQGRAKDIYLRAGELCWDMIGWMIQHQPTPAPQQGSPTFFKRRKPEQSVLPCAGSLPQLYDFVRMLDAPTYPLAFVEHGASKITFSQARLQDGKLQAQVEIVKKEPC
jgi:methionyl-tRNA formyltransferase